VLSINRKFPYGYLVSTSEQLGSIIRNTDQLPNQPNFIIYSLSSRDEQLVHPRDDIHRVVMIRDYSEFLLHVGEFQPTIRTLIFFDD